MKKKIWQCEHKLLTLMKSLDRSSTFSLIRPEPLLAILWSSRNSQPVKNSMELVRNQPLNNYQMSTSMTQKCLLILRTMIRNWLEQSSTSLFATRSSLIRRKEHTTLLPLMSLLLLTQPNNSVMNLLVKMEMKSWLLRHQRELSSISFLMFALLPQLERECLSSSRTRKKKSGSCAKVLIPSSKRDLVQFLWTVIFSGKLIELLHNLPMKVLEHYISHKKRFLEKNGQHGMKNQTKPNLLSAIEKKRSLRLMKKLKLIWNWLAPLPLKINSKTRSLTLSHLLKVVVLRYGFLQVTRLRPPPTLVSPLVSLTPQWSSILLKKLMMLRFTTKLVWLTLL